MDAETCRGVTRADTDFPVCPVFPEQGSARSSILLKLRQPRLQIATNRSSLRSKAEDGQLNLTCSEAVVHAGRRLLRRHPTRTGEARTIKIGSAVEQGAAGEPETQVWVVGREVHSRLQQSSAAVLVLHAIGRVEEDRSSTQTYEGLQVAEVRVEEVCCGAFVKGYRDVRQRLAVVGGEPLGERAVLIVQLDSGERERVLPKAE